MVDTKSAWLEFPGMPGFEVEVTNLSRNELAKLRKKCTITKFNRSSRQPVETLDEDKFVDEFTSSVVKGWKGLKLKYLESLVLIDLKGKDPEEELEFSLDNAKALVSGSVEFDTWLNDVVFDLENFRSSAEGRDTRTPGEVS